MMVLTTSAATILEEEREVLLRPVDTLRANSEVGHSGGLKGEERDGETRPLDESHAKFPTREGGVSMENWAKKRVGWELEVFEEEIREVPVGKARGKTANTDPSGRTPQDGVDTNIRKARTRLGGESRALTEPKEHLLRRPKIESRILLMAPGSLGLIFSKISMEIGPGDPGVETGAEKG